MKNKLFIIKIYYMNLLLNVLSETVNKNVEINEFDGLINEINSAFDKSIVIPKDVMNSFKLRKKLNDEYSFLISLKKYEETLFNW